MAKIRQSNLDEAIVTGLTELSESRADGDFVMVYDSSSGTLKKIQASNLGLVGPKISSVSPTNALSGDGTGNYTFTITGTNFAVGATAKLINSSGTDVAFDTLTRDSATQLTGVVAKSSLPGSGEPYDVSVTANQITVTLTDQINIDQSPEYATSAGSLATILNGNRDSTTLEVIASDPESAGNVTFELQSGSLPAGATATTVHENGVSKYQISGFSAVGSNTTSNFTLRAVDAASNTTSRAFSITVNAPVSESFTSSGTFSVPAGVTEVEVLVIAGGGAGAPNPGTETVGGGGAGGLIFVPAFSVTPGGSVPVTVGCGGGVGNPGQDSAFGTLTAKGGGTGGRQPQPDSSGRPGGSGGGGGRGDYGSAAGCATQPTQPGQSGAYGFGNPGGQSLGQTGIGGAGGGGAGGSGNNSFGSQPTGGGVGGAGKSYTIADGTTPVGYAGGGAGNNGGRVQGRDPTFGGGNPPAPADFGPTAQAVAQGVYPGTANRGGGGSYAGTGGKGIVIVRY